MMGVVKEGGGSLAYTLYLMFPSAAGIGAVRIS